MLYTLLCLRILGPKHYRFLSASKKRPCVCEKAILSPNTAMVVVGWYWVRLVVMRGRDRRPIDRGWDWRRGHGHCLMVWRLWYIWMMDETSVLLGKVAHPLHKTKLMATCANSWGTLPNRYARCFFKKLWKTNEFFFEIWYLNDIGRHTIIGPYLCL